MSKRKKSNGSFVHQFLDLYTEKGAGFAMLLLYKHFGSDGKAVNDVIPSLRKEGLKRGLDMDTLFKELNRAVTIDNGSGGLRAGSGNEADQPKDEDGPSEARANARSAGSRDQETEGST